MSSKCVIFTRTRLLSSDPLPRRAIVDTCFSGGAKCAEKAEKAFMQIEFKKSTRAANSCETDSIRVKSRRSSSQILLVGSVN